MNIFNLTQTTEEQRITMALESATEAIQSLRRKLDLAVKTMNYLSILQHGHLDYTQDFFEICKNTLRDTLDRIENEQ